MYLTRQLNKPQSRFYYQILVTMSKGLLPKMTMPWESNAKDSDYSYYSCNVYWKCVRVIDVQILGVPTP